MNTIMNNPFLLSHHEKLSNHTLYQKIKSRDDLALFMESHVFAVWDFMSLLKRLQKEITCTDVPWRVSPYPKKIVRLINEIVLCEESDIDLNGEVSDHFSLYLKAMEDIGANPARLISFTQDLDFDKWCLKAEKDFVSFNLNLATHGKLHEVAAAFFFGREKLIPDMFTSLLGDLDTSFEQNKKVSFPNLRYYLQRHIDVDGGEHSHLAQECLSILCQGDNEKLNEALAAGIESLVRRNALWDEVESRLAKS